MRVGVGIRLLLLLRLWVRVVFIVGWDWRWVGGRRGGTRIIGEQRGDDGIDGVGVDGRMRREIGMGREAGVDGRRVRGRICS